MKGIDFARNAVADAASLDGYNLESQMKPQKKSYQYKIVRGIVGDTNIATLNQYTTNGWKVVRIDHTEGPGGLSFTFILKREVCPDEHEQD